MCFEILSSRIVGIAFTVGGENKQTKNLNKQKKIIH